jgi:hypothetical protein
MRLVVAGLDQFSKRRILKELMHCPRGRFLVRKRLLYGTF